MITQATRLQEPQDLTAAAPAPSGCGTAPPMTHDQTPIECPP